MREYYERGGRGLVDMDTCIKAEVMGVLSPWKPRERERMERSFKTCFYLSDQRFGAHSTASIVKKYDFQSHAGVTFMLHAEKGFAISSSKLDMKLLKKQS